MITNYPLLLPAIHLISAMLYGGMAGYVILKNPKAYLNRWCALVLICFLIWSFGKAAIHHPNTPLTLAILFRHFVVLGAWTFSAFLLLFCLELTERSELARNKRTWAAVLIIPWAGVVLQWLSGSVLAYVPRSFGWGLAWQKSPMAYLLLSFIFLTIFLAVGLCFQLSLTSKNKKRVIQCRIIGSCILAGVLLGYVTNLLAPMFGWDIPDFAQNLGLFWLAGLVYAITKYELLTISPALAAEGIMANISDALILTDRSGAIETVNPAALAWLKTDRAAIIGSGLETVLVSKSGSAITAQQLDKLSKAKDVDSFLITSDKSSLPVSLSVSRVDDSKECPVGYVILLRDISKRIQDQRKLQEQRDKLEHRVKDHTVAVHHLHEELSSEKSLRQATDRALEQSNAMFRLISEQSLLGIVILQDNKIVYANESWAAITGFSVEEMLGWEPGRFLQQVHPEDRQHLMEQARKKQAGETDIETSYEWRLISKDGEERWISMYSQTIPYQDRIADLATLIDVSEQKRIFMALQESEEKYRLLIEHANDAVFIIQDEQVVFANPKALVMMGYDYDELIAKPFTQFLHPADQAASLDRYQRRIAGEPLPTNADIRLINKQAEVVSTQSNAVRLHWDGRPAVLSIVRDLTQEKKVERMLNHMQRLESLGTLSGGIAHDFNNLLTPIVGYGEMAQALARPDHKLHKYLHYILKSAYRAKDLVEQILLFSKQAEVERKPLKIQTLLVDVIALLRPSLPAHIEIKQRIENDCPAVLADATQIHQVIVNICTNAWQAMGPDGGTICIELFTAELNRHPPEGNNEAGFNHFVCIAITDDGPGMEPEVVERVFEPFFTTKSADKGTGLGLSVVHGIVMNHCGHIEIDSKAGRGTVFYIYLPVSEEQHQTDLSAPDPVEILMGEGRILILDDEVEIAMMVGMLLEERGYEVETFSDGNDALAAFRSDPDRYDCVLSDLTMPNISGVDVAGLIHTIREDIPVMIMTGYGDRLTENDEQLQDIAQVIRKPIDANQLCSTLRSIMAETI